MINAGEGMQKRASAYTRATVHRVQELDTSKRPPLSLSSLLEEIRCSHYGKHVEVPQNTKIQLLYDPASRVAQMVKSLPAM